MLFSGAFAAAAATFMFLVAALFWKPSVVAERGAFLVGDAVLTLLLVVLAVTFVVIVYGIRFSHRIAGPVYALSRNMSFVKQGRLTAELKLREKDQFQNLAGSFNTMLAVLREREQGDIDVLARLKEDVDQLAALAPGEATEACDRLARSLDSLLDRKGGYLKAE